MKNTYYLVALVILALTFGQCTKDETTLKGQQKNSNELKNGNIAVSNGRLVFTDSAVFKSHVQWIYQNLNNPSAITDFNSGKGFKSFFQIYDEGMNLADSAACASFISSHPFCFKMVTVDNEAFMEFPLGIISAYIANDQGIYQIGNCIIRETENWKSAIINGDENKLPKLFLDPNQIDDPVIKTINYNTDLSTVGNGQYSYKTSYWDSKKRIVARLYHSHEPNQGFPQYEARVTSQKKVLGVWWQENITSLCQKNYAGYYYTEGGTFLNVVTASNPDPVLNTSNIQWVIVYTQGDHIDFTRSSVIMDHWGYRGTAKREILNNDLFPN